MRITANLLMSLMLATSLLIISNAKAQDTSGTKHKGHSHNMEMNEDSSMNNMKMMNDTTHNMEMVNSKDSIVREGIIDLQKIDENKDGYIYQDVMDFNVISDKPGKCPICGMTLKKVSLKKAKETLIKNGFKVK